MNSYPRMLFPGGDTTQQYRIVADEAEDSSARDDGYAEAYSVAAKAPKAPAPVAAADAATAPAAPAAPVVADLPKRRGRPPKAN